MTDEDIEGDKESLEIITFCLPCLTIGVDIEDISGIVALSETCLEEAGRISIFEALSLPTDAHELKRPNIVVAKESGKRFVMEAPDDVKTVSLADVKLFPGIYEKCGKHPALWGVAIIESVNVLLVDINRL